MNDIRSTIEDTFGHQLRVRVCGVYVQNQKILLLGHRHLQNDGLFYSPPGGGVGFGESLEEALKREFLEETGLRVKIGNFLCMYQYLKPPLHAIELFFEITDAEGALRQGTDPEMGAESQIIEHIGYFDRAIVRAESHKFHPVLLNYPDFESLLESKSVCHT